MFNETTVTKALDKIQEIFTTDSAENLARETSLVQRASEKFKPLNFLILIVLRMFVCPDMTLDSMTDYLATVTGGCRMTPQALWDRLRSPFAVRFLHRAYSRVLEKKLAVPLGKCTSKGILARFTDVLIEDSTSVSLHSRAKALFKGVGGGASKSGYKIHLIWNCLSSDICSMKISGSSTTDQSTAAGILTCLTKGALIIRDLGYFSIPIFSEIAGMSAFFLSRFKRGVCVYTLDGELIEDLPKHLGVLLKNSSTVELQVLIGKKARLPVRLIAHRVPDDVYNQRMRRSKKIAKSQGYQVTKATKGWNRYNIFITNVPTDKLAAEEVAVLYGLRWQIELIFKAWKSCLQIDVIKGELENRIHCIILGRLIAILLISTLFSTLSRYIYEFRSRELSLHKFLIWIRDHTEILVSSKDLHSTIKIMESAIPNWYKQKRARKTTLGYLEMEATYDDLYPQIALIHPFEDLA
ncbi:Uncharacterized protein SCG7086_BI_00070 [Chlamydiales bacterium SCGC AG-110-P3]|nr:Uncharacterized protein SCG7086_BI_00070 [Chlamydiales bacterium SCGC AG-110-P3]